MVKKKNQKGAILKVDPYLEGLVAKLLDRLVSLENKVDLVVSQTQHMTLGSGQNHKNNGDFVSKPQPPRNRTMYEVRCSSCHKLCEVPFRPTESRPVFCKPCFAQSKLGGPKFTTVPMPSAPIPKMKVVKSFPSSIPKAISQIQAIKQKNSIKTKSTKPKSTKSKSAKPKKKKTKRKK